MTYLDHAATTPIRLEALEAMQEALAQLWANPSSAYASAARARAAVERARAQVAALMGASPEEIVFTSGGTEANNLALRGVMRAMRGRGRHMVTTAIEHSAVLATAKDLEASGYDLTVLGVDAHGLVDPDELTSAMRPDTVLVSVMHVNNEIGTIQPIEALGRVAREGGAYFHTDAVQSAGKLQLAFREGPFDLMSVASHKIYGPKGVGALAVGCDVPLRPSITGGSHERGLRAGTENVPGIVGFGVAAELAARDRQHELERTSRLAGMLREGLLGSIPGARLNGHPEKRLHANVHVTIPDVEGDVLLRALDAEGVMASAGSACRAQSRVPSHVLAAIGATSDQAAGSLRLTVGRLTDDAAVEHALAVIPRVVAALRSEHKSPLAQ